MKPSSNGISSTRSWVSERVSAVFMAALIPETFFCVNPVTRKTGFHARKATQMHQAFVRNGFPRQIDLCRFRRDALEPSVIDRRRAGWRARLRDLAHGPKTNVGECVRRPVPDV